MRERETLIQRLTNSDSAFTDEQKAARGYQAGRILESDVFLDAYADAELHLLQEWKDNEDSSPTGRERCHAAVKSLDLIWLALSRIVTEGVVAEERARQA